jgi:hypothetical protein
MTIEQHARDCTDIGDFSRLAIPLNEIAERVRNRAGETSLAMQAYEERTWERKGARYHWEYTNYSLADQPVRISRLSGQIRPSLSPA